MNWSNHSVCKLDAQWLNYELFFSLVYVRRSNIQYLVTASPSINHWRENIQTHHKGALFFSFDHPHSLWVVEATRPKWEGCIYACETEPLICEDFNQIQDKELISVSHRFLLKAYLLGACSYTSHLNQQRWQPNACLRPPGLPGEGHQFPGYSRSILLPSKPLPLLKNYKNCGT